MPRIYLDNAATSWPKPEAVYQAVDGYQRELGVAAGRGSYRDSDEVQRLVDRCRLELAKLIHANSAAEIIFTQNCTDALNLAIHGLLREGDHVVTSVADHNSILRPLHAASGRGVQFSTVSLAADGLLDLDQLQNLVAEKSTRLIAITHVSNVTGARQPIEAVISIARENGCLVLLDAAQSIGHEAIDVQQLGVDLLAAPGHKGLFGPLGTGLLYVKSKLHDTITAIRQGGTGTDSESPEQPNTAPYKFESGNLNVPGIVGLEAGLKFVVEQRLPESSHLYDLTERTIKLLKLHPAISIYSIPNRFGIVSFNLSGVDARELATALDSMAEIQVRAGLHCAPLMHGALDTAQGGGTVRASFGHFSKHEEVDTLVDAIEALITNPMI